MKKALLLFFLLLQRCPAFAQEEGFAGNGSVKIHYRTFGEGEPLLLINGGPGLSSDGAIVPARRLAEGGRKVILYDQRGTGTSLVGRPDSSTITMALMDEDLECLRRELCIESWSILGHSFGGMMAAYYTTKHPERVRSIIFCSSGGLDLDLLTDMGRVSGRLPRRERDSLAYWENRLQANDTGAAAVAGRARAMAPAYLFDRSQLPYLVDLLSQLDMRINNLVWQDLRRIRFDCKAALDSFAKPVLIIQGEQDIIPRRVALTAQRVLKNSRLVLLERCAHIGWLDRPDAYYPAVENFLKQE